MDRNTLKAQVIFSWVEEQCFEVTMHMPNGGSITVQDTGEVLLQNITLVYHELVFIVEEMKILLHKAMLKEIL
jgi:hypothetical protein